MLLVLKKAISLAASQAMTDAMRIAGTKRSMKDGGRLKKRRQLENDSSSSAAIIEERFYLFLVVLEKLS
jgi:hypothetical protein